MSTSKPRRLLPLDQAAHYIGRSERSLRNYITDGKITGYRRWGTPGLLVDLAELDAALTKGLLKHKYGPKARIVDLPPQAVIVHDGPSE